MKVFDILLLAVFGALFVNLSFSCYPTNWLGLVVGGLLMLPGLYYAIHDLWCN